MQDVFNGKNCLITGAASGIGRSTAIACGRLGARLFLTDINQSALEKTAAEITGSGGTVPFYQAFNIADHEAVRLFADTIHQKYGAMDIVMNIAGISIWGEVDRLTYQHWKKCIALGADPRHHLLSAGDDQKRPGRPPGQRGLRCRAGRLSLACYLQRRQVRAGGGFGGPAVRPDEAPYQRHRGLPGRGGDAFEKDR